ncbi:Nickel uptake substrate-specific transmembrane region [Jannaschia seosinensis]|uniref:Nickel uptake substrate-specific transmembrane region n=1 Tax=Jannaschia seosinensis TaxID=313367 RepID=A0A0M7B9M8_9RHOB|nr:DUF4198 domain-containing protein [Jannaschia seosinensis]CUH39430.1 Nickel uptake substrate-specific transmembrane region [Jannaschia seosinensis]
MKALFSVVLTAMCITGGAVQAHEFWIEAEDYTVDPGATVTASFRNGEELSGAALSYIPGRSSRFDMVVDGVMRPVPARIGDNPAFAVPDLPEGLLIVIHETTDRFVTYQEWEKWVSFTEHKDIAAGQTEHVARGLPQEGFRESYRRFAKALIAVGEGAGEDRAFGLRTEFVAEANPYTDDLSDGLPVRILLDGAPKAGAQIELFDKDADGGVTVTLHRADAEGRAVLPVRAGHEYLLDSVTLLPLEPEASDDPVWRTLWAALTFAVPEA